MSHIEPFICNSVEIVTSNLIILLSQMQTRAELEEIALDKADVARLKQKVAKLHQQLHQQYQHHYGSLSDASDRYQHVNNHNSQQ